MRRTWAKLDPAIGAPFIPPPAAHSGYRPKTAHQRMLDVIEQARTFIAEHKSTEADAVAALPTDRTIPEAPAKSPTPIVPPPIKAVLPDREMAMPFVRESGFMGIKYS